MQEVTGSSPVSPTISNAIERDTPPGPTIHQRVAAALRAATIAPEGTTRERPVNRPGVRPLARHERTQARIARSGRVKAGGTAGAEPLVLSMDEGFLDSRRPR